MSFILDALKKSENERQRQLGPALTDVQIRRARSDRPWWAFVLAGLLIVNLAVLSIVLLRSGDPDTRTAPAATTPQTTPAPAALPAPVPTVPQPTAAPTNSPAVQPHPAPAAPATASRPLAGEVAPSPAHPEEEEVYRRLAAAAAVPEGPPMVRPIEAPAVAPLPQTQAPAPFEEMLPTLNSLVAGGTPLPELRLDIHVYSPAAEQRFVYVNMRQYREGQTLREGPSVERITADGVVLNQQGMRFLLPRQ